MISIIGIICSSLAFGMGIYKIWGIETRTKKICDYLEYNRLVKIKTEMEEDHECQCTRCGAVWSKKKKHND